MHSLLFALSLATVPTPEAVLGFQPGARPATPAQITEYMRALAASSDRVQIETMGETHEGRPLLLLEISSPENLARADEVAEAFQKLSDPRKERSTTRAQAALDALPAVAWMGYSIHGNEMSGADASMVVAHRLATSDDEVIAKIRNNVIVYLDPMENPDGRQRAVGNHESNQSAVRDLDPASLHSSEMWPYGRGNHYLFDLNRDWFNLVHPESRARVPRITRVLPQLQVDAHEMGTNSTFLFPPSRHPFNPHRPPSIRDWELRFSRELAAAFDRNGWSYFTREWNEEFFPGYGSSWSVYLGAIGVLYEQAGTLGFTLKQRGGTLVSYADAVDHQATASFANLQSLANNRRAVLRSWLEARRSAATRHASSPFDAYVFRGDRHPARARRLARRLRDQGIEIQVATKPVALSAAHDRDGTSRRVTVPAGSYLVRLDQPNARLIRNLLDFHLPMDADFLREQRQYLERGKGSRLYETTAWSLPLAYGLDTYWLSSFPRGAWKTLEALPTFAGGVTGTGRYGYMFSGDSDRAIALAGRLLARGVALQVSREPTQIGSRTFPRGSFLAKNEGNRSDLRAILDELSTALELEVTGVSTALATTGTDLGGGNLLPLIEPRVAILAGDPIRPDFYGFTWHLLDQEAGLRLSRLNMTWLSSTDLERYNVLIVPHAYNLGTYQARLGEAERGALREWVRTGGTLIAMGNGTELVADPESEMTQSTLRRHVLESYPPVVFGLDPAVVDRAGSLSAVGLRASAEDDTERPSAGWPFTDRPYDVFPVYGPGAAPFVTSGPPPFEFPAQRQTLDAWAQVSAPKEEEAQEAHLKQADARLRRFMPSGVYLNAQVDPEHWLGYGVGERLPTYFASRDSLIADASAEVAVRFEDVGELHASGLLWPEAAGRLAKTAYLVRESVGEGQVILFNGAPAFRGTAFATQRILLNAVILGPGLGTRWPSPW